MVFTNLGIRAKILGGFAAFTIIALIIGITGYFSLSEVVRNANLNELAFETNELILEARRHEKNYIINNTEQSYQKLTEVLTRLGRLADQLQTEMSENKKGGGNELKEIQKKYLQAASDMKRITEENARELKSLQTTARKITDIADKENRKIEAATRERVLKASTEPLKGNALKEVRNIVALGYDVLQFYYQKGRGIDPALDTLRNMHFDGTNYYYVVQEDLTLVSHGSRRELEGMDFGKIQDKKTGKTFMREVVNNAIKDGESKTEYFSVISG